jgi:catechol 2,3-dioxygenase-like lactoylglutathione lyase family enzyme
MRINVVTIYVTDQDKAKSFYTDKLGFKLKDDVPYWANNRWLTVLSPEDDVTELYLAHEDSYPGAKAYREAMYSAGTPAMGFAVADVHAVHEQLSTAGVTFTRKPAAEDYGGHGASIDDGCGNILNLHQGA